MTSGYSSTPLAKKLSLKDGMRVWFLDMPDSVRSEIEGSDLTLSEDEVPAPGLHAAHIFVTEKDMMEQHLTTLREMIDPAGQVWVSWPKKASKVDTDITEDTIREGGGVLTQVALRHPPMPGLRQMPPPHARSTGRKIIRPPAPAYHKDRHCPRGTGHAPRDRNAVCGYGAARAAPRAAGPEDR